MCRENDLENWMSKQEVQDFLGISISTVNGLPQRARGLLKTRLVREGSTSRIYFFRDDIVSYKQIRDPEGYIKLAEAMDILGLTWKETTSLLKEGRPLASSWVKSNNYLHILKDDVIKHKQFQDQNYSPGEAAQFLGVPDAEIYDAIKYGKLVSTKIGIKHYIAKTEIEKYQPTEKGGIVPEGWVSTKQAADLFGVTHTCIQKWCKDGILKVTERFGSSGLYFSQDAINHAKEVLRQKSINNVVLKNSKVIKETDVAIEEVHKRCMEIFYPITKRLYNQYVEIELNESERADLIDAVYPLVSLSRTLNCIKKEFYLYTNKEVADLIHSLVSTRTLILSKFANYCRSETKTDCKYTTNYKRQYKRDPKTKQPKIGKMKFLAYFNFIKEININVQRAIIDSKYVQQWIYVMMHFFDAMRPSDILDLPNINLDLIGIFDLAYFETNLLSATQAQIIVNGYRKYIQFSANKTKAVLQFDVPDTFIPIFANALVIAEIHRRNFNVERLMFHMTKPPASTHIDNCLFKNYPELYGFTSLKATRGFLTHVSHWLEKEGKEHLVYTMPNSLRGHINGYEKLSNTTRLYIDETNEDGKFEDTCKQIVLRAGFGWVDVYALKLLMGDEYNKLSFQEQTNKIEVLQDNLSVVQIESFAKFLINQQNKGQTLIQELKAMPRGELIDRVAKMTRGLSPSLIPDAQCFMPEKCEKREQNPNVCLRCHRVWGNRYFLISLNEDLQNIVGVLERFSTNSPEAQKALTLYIGDIDLLQNAFEVFGEQVIDAFIDRKEIRRRLDAVINKERALI